MKSFIVAVVLGILMIGFFNYQSEVRNAGDQIEIQENYSIIFEVDASWGSVEWDPYLYVSGSDVMLRIYNPRSEVVYETLIKDGSVFDEVLFMDAEKGTWLMELNATEATITFDSSMKTLYLTSLNVIDPLKYKVLQFGSLFVVVFGVLLFCPVRAMIRSRSIIDKHHDADGLIELSKSLQCSFLRARVRNFYTLNIAAGHIYNGNYHEAKRVLDEIERDRTGEVKILRKWLKMYYLFYIGVLLELNQIEEAETLLKTKKELLKSKMPHKRDAFLTSLLNTLFKLKIAEYDQAKEQLIALKNMAVSDFEKSAVHYGLADACYHLGESINAQVYLEESRKTAYFRVVQEKIEDLEHKISY